MTDVYEGRPLSDPRQLLLARAALLDGDQAIRAWLSWSTSGSSIERLDYGSYRLLPLVFRNLSAAGLADERLVTLRGVFRHAWYSNQRLLHSVAGALDALAQAGVPTMLLKGAALVAMDPGLIGVRPMDDVDVLVPREHLRGALRRLGELGWRLEDSRPLEVLLDRFHSLHVRASDGRELDLHWRPFAVGGSDEALWRTASPAVLCGAPTLVPSAADQLALTCLHGLGWHPTPLRWIADAMLILKRNGDQLDWTAVLERARAWNDARALRETLGLLVREFQAPVPPFMFGELQRVPFDPVGALTHRVKIATPRSGFAWAVLWRSVRRLDLAGRPGAVGPLGRSRFSVALGDLRVDSGEPSVRGALVAVGRRFAQLSGNPLRARAVWFDRSLDNPDSGAPRERDAAA